MSKEILDTPMQDLRDRYPSMKRALFSAFHIGGCQSCAYGDEETLASVCERNNLDPQLAVSEIEASAIRDAEMMMEAFDLKELLEQEPKTLLLDTRTREEYEAVKIQGAQFLTQDLQNSLFTPDNYDRIIVLYDHKGINALDTCSWFRGHGLKKTYILKGGIDQWAQEVELNMPRYRLELD